MHRPWRDPPHERRRTRSVLAAVAGALCLTGASCGGEPARSDATAGSTGSPVAGDIIVFAAASLTDAFGAVGEAFTAAHPETDLVFNFAGSSELATQIVEGAPVDVFASADLANMARLTDAAVTDGVPAVFATNRAEIIVAPGNPLELTGVADLVDDDLVLVTCTPEVPCGAYAAQIFANAGVTVTPDSLEQNVKAVASKVMLGEADVGIVYATDVIAAGDRADGVAIPDDINVVAEYPIVTTADAPNPGGAHEFVRFLLGAAGQDALAEFGFAAP